MKMKRSVQIKLVCFPLICFIILNVLTLFTLADGMTVSANVMQETGRIDIAGNCSGIMQRVITLTLTDPVGKVVFIYDTESDSRGDFSFGFNLLQGSPDGDYNYNIKSSTGKGASGVLHMTFSNVNPSAVNINIMGSAFLGNTLEAGYKYIQMGGVPEQGTVIKWLISDTKGGNASEVTLGNTIELKNEYVGKYLRYGLTVKTATGLVGPDLFSDYVKVLAKPEISNLNISSSAIVGSQITANYKYSDLMGYQEYQTIYQWLRSSSTEGTYNVIPNETHAAYTPKGSDAGSYIKVRVTPRARVTNDEDMAAVEGDIAESNYTYISEASRSGGGGLPNASSNKNVKVDFSVTSIEPAQNQDNQFIDLNGHWAGKDIYEMFKKGIVKGSGANEFKPDAQVTRAMLIAMVVRSLNKPSAVYQGAFVDVQKGDWYADIIQAAVELKIVSGYNNEIRPNDFVTREEMAKIIVGACEIAGSAQKADSSNMKFSDEGNISGWAVDYVSKASAMGIIKGKVNNTFAAKDNTTRAEATVVVKRLLDLISK